MANMDPKRNPMPSQEPSVRARNFKEVALGYDEATAIKEAERCKESSIDFSRNMSPTYTLILYF